MTTTNASSPDRSDLVDVRDMLVVHTALLREFRLAPAAVRRVGAGDRRYAREVDQHLALICDMLHHHHHGEHQLLWPPLRDRVPVSAAAQLERAQAQHADIDLAIDRVAQARRGWVAQPDDERSRSLADELTALHGLLAEHLDFEERMLLPLAAAYLTEPEWHAIGEAGAASVPRKMMPLVFGMFSYEGDPEVLALMLKSAPAPVRRIVPRIAPRFYARRAARVHGTSQP